MSDDIISNVEKASLLPNRYYLILNYEDEDSFSMTAYDTTKGNVIDMENVPAGMVILSGMIEMMENDFDRVWDAGMARLSFVAMAHSFKPDTKEAEDAIDKVIKREDNIVKVNFGEPQ